MRNIEIDPQKLVELGLITLDDNEYIYGVHGHVCHSTGSRMSFYVVVDEQVKLKTE